jgi:hypothetical protein
MSSPRPQKIVLEFSDGSRKESAFNALPDQLQFDIMRQPFAGQLNPAPRKNKFVLLEWKDGWKEVIQVQTNCTEISRYYVISRPEEVGRLSLDKPDGYPELIEIVRKPLDLEKITFIDTFQLTREKSKREGKKTDHFFALSKAGDSFLEAATALGKILQEEGIELKELLSEDPVELQEKFAKISRQLGVAATGRQQDVFDFMAYLAGVAK